MPVITKDASLQTYAARIEALLAQGERRILVAFREAIAVLEDASTLTEVEAHLTRGQYGKALDIIRQAMSKVSAAAIAQFIAAGEAENVFILQAGVSVAAFNVADREAAQAITTMRSDVLDRLANAQHRAMIKIAYRRNPPLDRAQGRAGIARGIAETVGFTERQISQIESYRRALESGSSEALRRKLRDRRFDPSIRRAANGGDPLSPEEIDKQVARYAERMKMRRAKEIARQVSLRATGEGQDHQYGQAIRAGELAADDIIQTWRSVGDTKVRDSHRHLNNQKRAHGLPFEGLYSAIRYPGDPLAAPAETAGCRCYLTRRIRLDLD